MSAVLPAVVCVCLDIRIWSGQKKLSPSDLQLAESDLPPQQIATLGSKRLCDPSTLSALHRIESRARECCSKAGVKFLNAGGFPDIKARGTQHTTHEWGVTSPFGCRSKKKKSASVDQLIRAEYPLVSFQSRTSGLSFGPS